MEFLSKPCYSNDDFFQTEKYSIHHNVITKKYIFKQKYIIKLFYM
jgi:hypothetical protein